MKITKYITISALVRVLCGCTMMLIKNSIYDIPGEKVVALAVTATEENMNEPTNIKSGE